MTIKSVTILLALIVFMSSIVNSQKLNREKHISGYHNSDEMAIRNIVNEVSQGIKYGNINRVFKNFSSEQVKKNQDIKKTALFNTRGLNKKQSEYSFSNPTVSINGDEATFTAIIADANNLKKTKINFTLRKSISGSWEIVSAENFFDSISSFINDYDSIKIKTDSKYKQNVHSSSSVSVVTSTHMLIPIPFGWINGSTMWQATESEAEEYVGNYLFENPTDWDYLALSLDANGYISNSVTFVVDQFLDRIVFGEESSSTIKTYGDSPDDYQFNSPSAIQALKVYKNGSEQWIVYIAERGNKELVKLQYHPDTKSLSFLQSLKTNMIMPSDVVTIPWSQRGYFNGEHKLWVVDQGQKALLYMDHEANLLAKLTSYTYNGITYPLSRVHKILFKFDLYLVFIDLNQNAVVTIDWFDISNDTVNNNALATNFVKFETPSICNSIGVASEFQEFYVTDKGLNLVHKFSCSGEYLASFSNYTSDKATNPSQFIGRVGIPLFNNPIMFGSCNLNNPDIPPLSIFTLNKWSPTSGFQRFYDGADIVNVSSQPTSNGIRFHYNLTNQCYFTSQLVNNTGAVVKDFTNGTDYSFADKKSDYLDYSELSDGIYKWKGTVLPSNNDDYDIFSQNPVIVNGPKFMTPPRNPVPIDLAINESVKPTLTWNVIPGATSYNINVYNIGRTVQRTATVTTNSYTVPNDQPLDYDDWYTWEVTATGSAITSPTSKWTFKTRPFLYVAIEGPSCLNIGSYGTWTASVGGIVGTASYNWCYNYTNLSTNPFLIYLPPSNGTLKLTVTDASLSQTRSKNIIISNNCSSTPSCPFVFVWNGATFREDNNILPQSEYEENLGKDVTDYYRLLKPLKQKNGKYILQIREFENELSYFDEFKLIAIDHPDYTKIDAAPSSGEIFHYITPYRLNKANIRNKNILAELAEFDSTRIIVEPGDTIRLSLQQFSEKSSPYATLMSLPPGEEGGGDGLPKTSKMAYNAHPKILSGLDGVLTFRQRPTLVFVPATIDNLNSWDVVWTQRARLDYLNYGVMIPTLYQKRTLPLVSARHSSLADVKSKLSSMDSVYAVLSPFEFIELQFQGLPLPPDGTKRTFVLYSRGRYEQLSDSSVSPLNSMNTFSTFQIDNIFPNPFNPTTKISFRQPTDGYTKIIIYDMIGREVARLADGNTSGGIHEVTWNAGNIASGIYFCRYTVTNSTGRVLHQEVKKLILTR